MPELPQTDPPSLSEGSVFTNYSQRLASLAERHLSERLKTRVDGEDIAQSAFRTFFRRRDAGEFHIDSSSELWQLLAHITVRKAQAHGRRHTAQKRDMAAEETAEDCTLASQQPRPEDAVIVEDEIERILKDLPEQYSSILGLLLEGHSKTDVAEKMELSRMTIHRVVDVLKERLSDPEE